MALALAATMAVERGSRFWTVSPPKVTGVPHLERSLTAPVHLRPAAPPRVWLVESRPAFDLYSNGLRLENQFSTSTEPRRYAAFARTPLGPGAPTWRVEPAGIVFHSTESHIAPFEEDQNQTLRRAGEGLLEYVSRKRAYHFVIDRFGRVFRIVRESDRANHAGHSVWADETWIYVNLNESFLGVAFEARTPRQDEDTPLNPAQIHAGRILTDMLRARYRIAAENCVAHAQVSVNPDNGRAGYHTDWAAHLPFHDLGLGDNYTQALPSVILFGFATDSSLENVASPLLRQTLLTAENQIQREAAAQGLSVDRYREILQQRYQKATRAFASTTAFKENQQ